MTRALRVVLLGASLAAVACGGDKGGGAGGAGAGGATTTTTTTSSTTTTSTSSTTTTPVACPSGGTETPALTMCTTPDTKVVTVPKGCAPTVDGVVHDVEWQDGACFNGGGLTVVVKYQGDSLYMAMSGPPSCGCGMQFYFEPLGKPNFVVSLFDDPFGMDGDRADFVLTGSGLQSAMKDASIVTACPGNMPSPVRYEWKIPLAKLGITPGKAGQFQMAITHSGLNWPSTLNVDASMHAVFEAGEPSWGALKASNWL